MNTIETRPRPALRVPSCTLNIDAAGRRLRAAAGGAALLAAAGSALAMMTMGADAAWRLTLFFPLLAGVVGLLQAREGT